MKNLFNNIAVLICLIILSCSENSENVNLITNKEFDVISHNKLSGNGSEGISESNLVIDNDSDWQNLILQMDSVNNVSSSFSETNIDFDNFIVIAIFLDIKPSGWKLKISNLEEDENNIYVSINEEILISTVMTQPFSIVKIPTTSKPIIFN